MIFRYPGAKSKLIPYIMEHLDVLLKKSNNYVEPFVGGGSVFLHVAIHYPYHKIFINDKDELISAFWKVLSLGNVKELFELMEQEVTINHFYNVKNSKPTTEAEKAYKGIFLNRTCFSGIQMSGPIGGEKQLSKYKVDCRYNLAKLKKEILEAVSIIKDRVTVENVDICDYKVLDNDYPCYLDPPYLKAGKSLYAQYMSYSEHKDMAKMLNTKENWVLSIDDELDIREFYKNNKIIDISARYSINGKKSNWANKNELIILK